MAKRATPLLWMMFSIGGTIAALLFPIHVLLNGLLFPLGWTAASHGSIGPVFTPSYESLHGLVLHPLTRLYLFVLIAFPLFHWAHRFRYTLYDGLQLYHLTRLIAVICYGAAAIGTAIAAYTLWNIS